MADKRDESWRKAEALDLLADVRASISAEAALETERRMAAEAARQAEASRRLLETSALQRAEIEARLAAEAARQRAAAEERALRARIDPADRAEPGAVSARPRSAPTPAPQAAPERASPDRAFEVAAEPFAPTLPVRGRTAFFAIVVGLPVACVTAVALALVARDRGVAPPEAPAAVETAAVPAPMAARVEASSAPVASKVAAGKATTVAGGKASTVVSDPRQRTPRTEPRLRPAPALPSEKKLKVIFDGD